MRNVIVLCWRGFSAGWGLTDFWGLRSAKITARYRERQLQSNWNCNCIDSDIAIATAVTPALVLCTAIAKATVVAGIYGRAE
jgi:hypothetical protein